MTEVPCNNYVKVKCNKPYVLKAPKQHGNECNDSCSSSCIDYSALKGDKREPPHCNEPCFLKFYGPECSESSSSSSSCDDCAGCVNGCGGCRSCDDYKKKKHLIRPLKNDKCSESSSSSSSECLPKVKVCIEGKHKEFCHQPVEDCPKCPKVCCKQEKCDYLKLDAALPPYQQICPPGGHRPCTTGKCANVQVINAGYGQQQYGNAVYANGNNVGTTYTVSYGRSDRHPNQSGVGNYEALYVNGHVAPILHMKRGRTYRFVVNTANGNGQFYLSNSPVGDGSTVMGTSAMNNGSMDYTVDDNSPSVMYYHLTGCNNAGNAIVIHNNKQ